nr:MAG TPA: hypothetical protein [Caudoviricetes sp.]
MTILILLAIIKISKATYKTHVVEVLYYAQT